MRGRRALLRISATFGSLATLAILAAFGSLATYASGAQAAPKPLACPPEDVVLAEPAHLARLSAALRRGGVLNVLAVGSALGAGRPDAASTKSAAAASTISSPAAPGGFAVQMARTLEAANPRLHVTVDLSTHRGLSAGALLESLRAGLRAHPYGLVIWQTGTVDAADEVPIGDFYTALTEGAAAVQDAGADLVLVDAQYSRFLEANANLGPYEGAMQAAAIASGALLFHRLDLMRGWAESGALDLEYAAPAERPAVAARLHSCLGQALGRALLAAAAQ